ncbi:MFS transporter [Actinoallomurus sp. WRP6H-15]|nr:MFS transporter [Actinoallomurus soli]
MIGQARLMRLAALVNGAAFLLFPLTGPGRRLACYALADLVTSFCLIGLNIVQVSFHQTVCPERLLGRVNATMKFLIWGGMPLGSVLGGLLATAAGLRATLWTAAAGVLLAALWLLLSPLRTMRDLPPPDAYDIGSGSCRSDVGAAR